MEDFCVQLGEFKKFQTEFIEKHLTNFKTQIGIEDKNLAVMLFIYKYSWLIRDIYCNNLCINKACKFKKSFEKTIDFIESIDYIISIAS